MDNSPLPSLLRSLSTAMESKTEPRHPAGGEGDGVTHAGVKLTSAFLLGVLAMAAFYELAYRTSRPRPIIRASLYDQEVALFRSGKLAGEPAYERQRP